MGECHGIDEAEQLPSVVDRGPQEMNMLIPNAGEDLVCSVMGFIIDDHDMMRFPAVMPDAFKGIEQVLRMPRTDRDDDNREGFSLYLI
jgi:hypothetical protein